MPLTPIVWNGRLFLFWLQDHQDRAAPAQLRRRASRPATSQGLELATGRSAGLHQHLGTSQSRGIDQCLAVLHWSEFYNGKWQPTEDIGRSTGRPIIGSFAADDRIFDVTATCCRLDPDSTCRAIRTRYGPVQSCLRTPWSWPSLRRCRTSRSGRLRAATTRTACRCGSMTSICGISRWSDESRSRPSRRTRCVLRPRSSLHRRANTSGTLSISYITYAAGNVSTTVDTNNAHPVRPRRRAMSNRSRAWPTPGMRRSSTRTGATCSTSPLAETYYTIWRLRPASGGSTARPAWSARSARFRRCCCRADRFRSRRQSPSARP